MVFWYPVIEVFDYIFKARLTCPVEVETEIFQVVQLWNLKLVHILFPAGKSTAAQIALSWRSVLKTAYPVW